MTSSRTLVHRIRRACVFPFTAFNLVALAHAAVPSPYGDYEADNNVQGSGPEVDSDGDGIPNGLEFILGGISDPAAPDRNSLGLLPAISDLGGSIGFSFHLSAAAAAISPAVWSVEFSDSLSGTWTSAVDPANSTISITPDGNGPDGFPWSKVTVTIPKSGSRQFVRLRSGVTAVEEIFDYYVSSTIGNDSNDGRSVGAPFKTLGAAVAAVGFRNNLKVGLARGSSWKEQFVFPFNSGLEIGAYGPGSLPLIDAGDTIPSASFSPAPGTALTYQADVSFTGSLGNEQRLIWENGANLVQVSSIAAVEATPGSFFYSNYDAASATVYVHAKDDSNPSGNGRIYDYSKRYFALSISGADAVVQGIRTRRQRANDGSLVIHGDGATIRNGIADDGNKHSIFMGENSRVERYTFRNAYNGPTGTPNYLVFFKSAATGLGMAVNHTKFITDPAVVPSTAGYPTTHTVAVVCHVSTGALGNVVTHDNTMSMTDGYVLQNLSGLTSTDDTWINSSTMGNSTAAMTASFIRPTYTITETNLTGTVVPFFSSSNPAAGRLSVSYDDLEMNLGTYSGRISGNSLDTTITNSLVTTGAQSGFPLGAIRVLGTGGTLTVNGTTLDTSAWASPTFYNLAADTVYTGDNNRFIHATGTPNWQRNNVNQATSLETWKTYSGQDTNSLNH